MRATLLALLLATASSHAIAGWELSTSKTMMFQSSVDQTAWVIVGCDNSLRLFRRTPATNLRWRIDTHTEWLSTTTINPETVMLTGDEFPWYGHHFAITETLLNELITGGDMRVHWGDTDYDRFSLVGFTRVLNQLECNKKSDREYFL